MSIPFGTPWLVFADSLRVVVGVVGVLVFLATIIGALSKRAAHDDRLAYGAIGLLTASVVGSSFGQLGDLVTWPMWTDAAGVVFAALVVFRCSRPRARFPSPHKQA